MLFIMSFSRAPVKRFNESKTLGPAPGYYNVKDSEKAVGAIKFEFCSERFKANSENGSNDGPSEAKDFAVPAALPGSCSKRKLNFSNSKGKSAEKHDRSNTPTSSNREKETYEREIRKLLQQCSEREHDLKNARDELQRLQGKIGALTKDKLLLESRTASLDKSVSALQKENELLKTNSSKETSFKKVEAELKEMKNAFALCKQEIQSKDLQMISLQAALQEAKTKISALEEANKVLETFNKDIQKHDNDVTEHVTKLQGISDKLRDQNSILQDRLESTQAMLLQIEDMVHNKLTAQLANFLDDFQSKSDDINSATLNLQDRTEAANQKVEKLSRFMAGIRCERDSLRESLSDLHEKVDDLEKERETILEEKSELAATVIKREEDVSAAKDEVTQLSQQMVCVQSELESVSSKHKDEVRTLTIENDKLKEEMEAAKLTSTELSDQVDRLNDENNRLKLEAGTLQEEYGHMKEDLNQKERVGALLRNECEELSGKLTKKEMESKLNASRAEELMEEIKQCNEMVMESKKSRDMKEKRCNELEESLRTADETVRKQATIVEELRTSLKEQEAKHDGKISEFTRRLHETQKKLNQRDNELKAANEELASASDEVVAKKKLIEELTEEKEMLQMDYSQLTIELDLVKTDKTTDDLWEEIEKWKSMFEELQEKVKPFQTQLDAYSAEKVMLLSKTTAAQAEASKLGKKYAELLGHQNHKQKIKHIVKLKEQNDDLREKNEKLRVQVSSLQKQVIEHRKPRFDPSRAFQHSKENSNPNPVS